MSLKSITASWIIALCLLGLVSLLNHPPATEEASHERLFILPDEQSPANETQVLEMEAKVWCALTSEQQLQYRYEGSIRTTRGAMGINPSRNPTQETMKQDEHMQECERLRIGQLASQNPALDHLFTTLQPAF